MGGIPERIESEKMGTTKKDQKGATAKRNPPKGESIKKAKAKAFGQANQCLKRGQKGKASLQPRISAIWL